jgi:RNA polymerase sigma-70 factor (ECF subfamily)
MDFEKLHREESGRILATLIGLLGDFDLAEEMLQEAYAIALQKWPTAGTPANPRAWLISTARHKAIDRLRRDQRFELRVKTGFVRERLERASLEGWIPDEATDFDALKASGRFAVLDGPATRWGAQGNATSLYILDPDGNTVELRYYG